MISEIIDILGMAGIISKHDAPESIESILDRGKGPLSGSLVPDRDEVRIYG
jgi:hypothetical protein